MIGIYIYIMEDAEINNYGTLKGQRFDAKIMSGIIDNLQLLQVKLTITKMYLCQNIKSNSNHNDLQ